MRRIDLGWQARWESLKLLLKELAGESNGDPSKQSCYKDILKAMARLENLEKLCLSRPIMKYRSPATGVEREVWRVVDGEMEPVPGEIEETNRKEFPA